MAKRTARIVLEQVNESAGLRFKGIVAAGAYEAAFNFISRLHMDHISPNVNAEGIDNLSWTITLQLNPTSASDDVTVALIKLLFPLVLRFHHHPRTRLYNEYLLQAMREAAKAPPAEVPGQPLIQDAMFRNVHSMGIDLELEEEFVEKLF